MSLKVGDKAPLFTLVNDETKEVSLQDYQGRNLVVLFFPLAFTGVSGGSYKIVVFVANVFTGITGVAYFSAITRFSGLWFPPEQRATATGLSITCANIGSLLPAIVGPWLIDEPPSRDVLQDPEKMGPIQVKLRTQIFHYMLVCKT